MDRSRLEDQDEVPMTPRSPADEDRERLLDVDIDKPSPAEGQDNLARNLINNYAMAAQGGIWGLTLVIWAACFFAGIIFFSAHVLLNSMGLLLITQSILILQPTSTPTQKRRGTALHFIFNAGSLSALLAGLVIIEVNKFSHDGEHFKSLHAVLGLVMYLFLLLQGVVGFTQYYTPMVYGSVDRAKSIWKYHRIGGYVTITMGLLTVLAATQTGYNQNVLHIPLWLVIIASVFVVVGIVPRISLRKLGFGR